MYLRVNLFGLSLISNGLSMRSTFKIVSLVNFVAVPVKLRQSWVLQGPRISVHGDVHSTHRRLPFCYLVTLPLSVQLFVRVITGFSINNCSFYFF